MFEEDAEERKAGLIGTAIIGAAGALIGALGVIGFGKGKQMWDEHKAKEAEAQAAEEVK